MYLANITPKEHFIAIKGMLSEPTIILNSDAVVTKLPPSSIFILVPYHKVCK